MRAYSECFCVGTWAAPLSYIFLCGWKGWYRVYQTYPQKATIQFDWQWMNCFAWKSHLIYCDFRAHSERIHSQLVYKMYNIILLSDQNNIKTNHVQISLCYAFKRKGWQCLHGLFLFFLVEFHFYLKQFTCDSHNKSHIYWIGRFCCQQYIKSSM